MGKVLWNTMMSLDGFIAGPNDDMQWVFGVDGGAGRTVHEVVRSTGALLVGRRTQDVEDRLRPGFYGGAFRAGSKAGTRLARLLAAVGYTSIASSYRLADEAMWPAQLHDVKTAIRRGLAKPPGRCEANATVEM